MRKLGRATRNQDPLVYLDMKRMAPVMGMFAVACGFYLTMAGSAMAILARDLGKPVAALALIGSMYGIALIMHGVAAPFTLRYGPVWLLRFAPMLVIIGLMLLVWCPNLGVVLAGAMIAAIGTASSSVINAATFPGSEGVSYLSVVAGIASATSIATTVIFAAFERAVPGSGRFALVLMVIPSVVMLVWAWRLPAVPLGVFLAKPTNPAFVRPIANGENMGVPHSTERNSGSGASAQPTRSKASRAIVLAQVARVVLIAGVEYPFYAWSVEKITSLGEPLAVGSAVATAFAIGMALGRIFGAPLLKNRHSIPVFLMLGITGSVLTGYGSNLWVVTGGLLIAGIGVSCLFPIGASDFSSLPGIAAHKASGAVMVLSGVGGLVTPLVLGVLLTALGIEAGFALIATLFVLLLVIPRPTHE